MKADDATRVVELLERLTSLQHFVRGDWKGDIAISYGSYNAVVAAVRGNVAAKLEIEEVTKELTALGVTDIPVL